MADLKKAFERCGYSNVKTILASGNVVFDAERATEASLIQQLEPALTKALRYDVKVVVRTVADVQRLFDSQPFKKIKVTPQTRTFVTFLKDEPSTAAMRALGKGGNGYTIVRVADRAVCSVVDLSVTRTPDLMAVVEKAFGKGVTTRSWNTVARILKAAV